MSLPDDRVRELWRSVQGPYAELTGPLIRFAALLFEEGRQATDIYHDQSCVVCGIKRAAHPGMEHAFEATDPARKP
jgi:hypothetical protein